MTEARKHRALNEMRRADRWYRLVRYTWRCECCGRDGDVAVVPYYGERIRVCHECLTTDAWRTSARERVAEVLR